MRTAWMWALVAVIGCKKTTTAADCPKEAHELVAFLAATDHGTPPVHVDGLTHLVTRPDAASPSQIAPTIKLERGQIDFQGRLVSLGELGDQLVDARRGKDPLLVNVVIDDATSWADVVSIAKLVSTAGLTHLGLIFARPPVQDTPPPPSSVDGQLDAIEKADPNERATKVAELMMTKIKPCPQLEKVFGAVSGVEGEDKGATLVKAMEPALVACACAVDLPAVRTIMYRLLRDKHPTSTVTVTLEPSATVISLAGTTPWREASTKITKDATAWLDVLP